MLGFFIAQARALWKQRCQLGASGFVQRINRKGFIKTGP
jgi:hypothetical protein